MVHHILVGAGKLVFACLVMAGFAALANLGVGLSAGSLWSATPSPAEVVASRFPSADTFLSLQPAKFSTASVMPVEHWEAFDQTALSAVATADPALSTTADPASSTSAETPTAVENSEPTTADPPQQPVAAEPAKPEPPKAQVANATQRRTIARSGNVLNDAQITSIKRRLKLTPEQERMWPAVEAALRKIVYTKTAMDPHAHAAQSSGSPHTTYIDPNSTEVRQLKEAAFPLIMRLNEEQKREVKMLAYVMGLEAVASQF